MRRLVRTTSRALPLLAAAALSACASANRPATRVTGAEAIRATLDSAGLLAQEEGPEIRLRAEQDFGNPSNIDAVLRLDDDAYVMVVNVGPDGYARVVFPQAPADDGLLRAGRSYRLPSFFPGFASYTAGYATFGYGSRFVPFQRSEYASVMARGPGFVFAIASSRPMDLQMVEELGMWDDFRIPQDGLLLDPKYVVEYYRETALGEGKPHGVSAAVARYAGWVPGSTRMASATCISPFGYGPSFSSLNWRTGYGFSSFPIWATTAMDYGIGDAYCGMRQYYVRAPYRFAQVPPIVVQNPGTQPTPPTPVDSGATDPGPKPQTRPVGHPRDPLNPPIPGTPATIIDGETLDLSPRTRRIARQETLLSRERRMIEEAGVPAWMHGAGSGGRPMPRGVEPSGSAGGRNGNSVSLPGRRETIERAAGSGGSARPSAPVSAPAPAPAPSPAADAPGTRGSGQKPAPPPQ